MRLPPKILATVRGPVLALAVTGCAAAEGAAVMDPPPELTTEPDVAATIVAAPADVVDYDAEAELARLDRVDQTEAREANRRERRIDAQARARAVRYRAARPPSQHHQQVITLMRLCGRG